MPTCELPQAYFRTHGPQRTPAQIAQQRAELLANVPDDQRKNLDERTLQVADRADYPPATLRVPGTLAVLSHLLPTGSC